MRELQIQVRKAGDVCVLDLTGELKLGQATIKLREKSKELVAAGERRFILNMENVPWLDSSGIGEVFASYKRARAEGGVVKLVLRGKSLSLFTFTELHRVFEIFQDLETALGSFNSPPD